MKNYKLGIGIVLGIIVSVGIMYFPYISVIIIGIILSGALPAFYFTRKYIEKITIQQEEEARQEQQRIKYDKQREERSKYENNMSEIKDFIDTIDDKRYINDKVCIEFISEDNRIYVSTKDVKCDITYPNRSYYYKDEEIKETKTIKEVFDKIIEEYGEKFREIRKQKNREVLKKKENLTLEAENLLVS